MHFFKKCSLKVIKNFWKANFLGHLGPLHGRGAGPSVHPPKKGSIRLPLYFVLMFIFTIKTDGGELANLSARISFLAREISHLHSRVPQEILLSLSWT